MMEETHSTSVLMIGLDAAEPSLIEQWINDGSLQNLKRLRARGSYSRLASSADWLAGSPWPTFYTGTTPADHGLYHYLQWRADKMVHVRPSPDWLPLRPFWRALGKTDRRVVTFDIPMTFSPKPFNGVEISGWATHDQLAPPASYPQSVMGWIRREFGQPPLSEEFGGLQSPKSLLQLRDELIEATERAADVAVALMNRETWDLFMCAFGATHRGGHKLWDITNALGDFQPIDQVKFSHALRDVYIACDKAVGQLVEIAGEGVTILVFSLHGMGPNTSRTDFLLSKMLDRILSKEVKSDRGSMQNGYLQRLRSLIPLEWRYNIRRWLPFWLQDRLTAFWRMGGIDWTVTPAANLVADLQGYIRINLCEREAAGIVEPGEEYDRLCAEIIEGLGTFVDADTGEPVVESVMRSDRLFSQGARRYNLPDLLVRWVSSPAANHRAIMSPRYGSIPWPIPGRNPDGRSGNHRPEGFLIAVGDRIQPGSRMKDAHILDLAPTVYALLDLPKPTEMCGKVLSAIRSG
jgi:predicted AlkP superfamily phosphohydrolase/phosphomutase